MVNWQDERAWCANECNAFYIHEKPIANALYTEIISTQSLISAVAGRKHGSFKKEKEKKGGVLAANQCIYTRRSGQENLLKFKQSIGMERKVIYVIFSVADRWSEYFKTFFCSIEIENGQKTTWYPMSGSSLDDVSSQEMATIFLVDRKVTVTHTATYYNKKLKA